MFLIDILYLLCILIVIAYFTLLERKIMASIQRRTGPKVVGFYGILQPITDGLKLLTKEIIIPQKANKGLFLFAPIFSLIIALIPWSFIPFDDITIILDVHLGLLFLLTISSLNVYGLVLSGWSSNSKYAFLGALRSTAQVISYELTIGFIFIIIGSLTGSFNLLDIVSYQTISGVWLCFSGLPLFLIFLIAMLAETNRIPFDLSEAEAEIVAGYNIEYSSIVFAMFFLAEYSNMLVMSALGVLLFFGGWNLFPWEFRKIEDNLIFESEVFGNSGIFAFKMIFFAVFYVLVRSTLPRYRYDQLMYLGWKILLPLIFALLIFYVGFVKYMGILIYEFPIQVFSMDSEFDDISF